MTAPAVSAAGLVKRFGKATVLDVDALELAGGEVHCVVGPNGSGKTTLLRIVAGLDRPDSGKVTVLGADPAGLSPGQAVAHRRRVGFCSEKPYLFRATVRRNVEYPLRVRGVERSARARSSGEALERLGVESLAERDASSLSAGERARVAVARAIAPGPELLLLDEPFANVDPEAVPVIEKEMARLASRGTTVVVATHLVDRAYELAAGVVRLEGGRLAPPAIENVLEGELETTASGPVLALGGDVAIHVVTERRGRVRGTVSPADIILSAEPFDSSARNVLRGRVRALRERGGAVLVTADACPHGPDGGPGRAEPAGAHPDAGKRGVALTASVTPESCERLGLTAGSEVFLTFKATAVKLF